MGGNAVKQIGLLLVALGLVAASPLTGAQETHAPTAVTRAAGQLRGTVTDASGNGLSGTAVKVFEEGFLIAEGATAAGGAYEIEFEYAPELDWTMVVWYLPERADLIPEIVLLRESLRSNELELWSSCLPRIELKAVMKYDLHLYDETGKLNQMSDLDCLEN